MASEENRQTPADSQSSQSLSLVQSHDGFPSIDQLGSFAQRLALRLPYLQLSPTRTLNLNLNPPSQNPQDHLLPAPQQPETEIEQPQQTQQPETEIEQHQQTQQPETEIEQPQGTQQPRNGLSVLIPLLTSLARRQAESRGESQTHMVVFFNQGTGSVMVFEGTSEDFGVPFPWGEKRGTLPASKAAIEAMARVEVEESGKECAICLEEFAVGEVVREMPCKHDFHGGCIEKWLNCHGSCPVCRYVMPFDEDTEETKTSNANGGGGGGLTVHAFFVGSGGGGGADEDLSGGGGDVEG